MGAWSSYEDGAAARVGLTLSGKWKLERLLGVGGMAAVYAATHRNGTRAAIKVFRPGLVDDVDARERFLREGYLANKVGHPGVVRVFDDHLGDDGSAYLVMELVDGRSLQHRFEERGPEPPREVLRVVDAVLAILEVAHREKVVHRDLKPENVLVDATGTIRVLDFGIARALDANAMTATAAGTAMGTPAYMPPEQALGKRDLVDARADLFAVGAMTFFLLTGELVQEGETAQELVVKAAFVPARSLVTVWPDAPPPLVRLLERACAFERDDRFPDATAMRAEVERVASLVGDAPAFRRLALDRTEPGRVASSVTPSPTLSSGGDSEAARAERSAREGMAATIASGSAPARPTPARGSGAAAARSAGPTLVSSEIASRPAPRARPWVGIAVAALAVCVACGLLALGARPDAPAATREASEAAPLVPAAAAPSGAPVVTSADAVPASATASSAIPPRSASPPRIAPRTTAAATAAREASPPIATARDVGY